MNWKTFLFVLLAGNIVVVSIIFILINWPQKDRPLPHLVNDEENEIQFEVKTTRDNLTKFINQYLERKGINKNLSL